MAYAVGRLDSPPPYVPQASEGDRTAARTRHLALTILGSLASFVFLPWEAAFLISGGLALLYVISAPNERRHIDAEPRYAPPLPSYATAFPPIVVMPPAAACDPRPPTPAHRRGAGGGSAVAPELPPMGPGHERSAAEPSFQFGSGYSWMSNVWDSSSVLPAAAPPMHYQYTTTNPAPNREVFGSR